MTAYETIIEKIKQSDILKAENMEEEIDIIRHKLKFLTEESLPNTLILAQQNNYHPLYNDLIVEKVKVAGGILMSEYATNVDCIIIKQDDESLYSQIGGLLESENIKNSNAIKNNNLFIIQNKTFNESDENYLADVEILAEILQPKYFVYGRNGEDWVKFDL